MHGEHLKLLESIKNCLQSLRSAKDLGVYGINMQSSFKIVRIRRSSTRGNSKNKTIFEVMSITWLYQSTFYEFYELSSVL